MVQTFKDGKNYLKDDPVIVSIDQAKAAIAKIIRDIGQFKTHILLKTYRRFGQISVPNGRKYGYELK